MSRCLFSGRTGTLISPPPGGVQQDSRFFHKFYATRSVSYHPDTLLGLTLYLGIEFTLCVEALMRSKWRRNGPASTCRLCATTSGGACFPARRGGRRDTASFPMTPCASFASSSAPRIPIHARRGRGAAAASQREAPRPRPDRAVAEERVRHVERKIAELEAMKKALSHLIHCCREGLTLDCPIIEALDSDSAAR